MKRIRVGDRITLPSGMKFKVTCAADPKRPWAAVHLGRHWHVMRERHDGGRLGVEHYFGGHLAPLQLDEADAESVAAILNEVRP